VSFTTPRSRKGYNCINLKQPQTYEKRKREWNKRILKFYGLNKAITTLYGVFFFTAEVSSNTTSHVLSSPAPSLDECCKTIVDLNQSQLETM